jgi:pSer/pThr/pTyr-binding forkhead associated (FHA) protein
MCGVSSTPRTQARSRPAVGRPLEAEQAGRPFLLYKDADDAEQLLLFASGSSVAVVGRDLQSDLPLNWDEQVSRLHARFELAADYWEIVDDHSSNGTFLNEERVNGRRRLKDGDTLRFGVTTVIFRSPQPAIPDTAAGRQAPVDVLLSTTQRRVLVALFRLHAEGERLASLEGDQQLADDLFMSVGAFKTHVSVLCAKLDIEQLPQAERRTCLVERALDAGLIVERDL